jgi:hypothetical protein
MCVCVCVYSYVCSCVCTALDLEQRYSNEREKYFTEEQRETVQNLRKIKAAAENKGILCEYIFLHIIVCVCVCVCVCMRVSAVVSARRYVKCALRPKYLSSWCTQSSSSLPNLLAGNNDM